MIQYLQLNKQSCRSLDTRLLSAEPLSVGCRGVVSLKHRWAVYFRREAEVVSRGLWRWPNVRQQVAFGNIRLSRFISEVNILIISVTGCKHRRCHGSSPGPTVRHREWHRAGPFEEIRVRPSVWLSREARARSVVICTAIVVLKCVDASEEDFPSAVLCFQLSKRWASWLSSIAVQCNG